MCEICFVFACSIMACSNHASTKYSVENLQFESARSGRWPRHEILTSAKTISPSSHPKHLTNFKRTYNRRLTANQARAPKLAATHRAERLRSPGTRAIFTLRIDIARQIDLNHYPGARVVGSDTCLARHSAYLPQSG